MLRNSNQIGNDGAWMPIWSFKEIYYSKSNHQLWERRRDNEIGKLDQHVGTIDSIDQSQKVDSVDWPDYTIGSIT